MVTGSADQTIKIWNLSNLSEKIKNRRLNIDLVKKIKKQAEEQTKEEWSISEVLNFMEKNEMDYYMPLKIPPQLNLFISKNDEWITWTNEGYFNASEKGMDFIYFHLNQGADKEAKAIPLKRLYDHFFRPDLVKLKLSGDEEAYQKAINGLDFKKALKNPPPTVTINTINTKNTNTIKDKIKISFNIKDEKGGIGLIRIYQEGKLIQTIGEGEIKRQSANLDTFIEQSKTDKMNKKSEKILMASLKPKGNVIKPKDMVGKTKIDSTQNREGEHSVEVELKAGSNNIAIEAFNKTNTVSSYRPSVNIQANIVKHKPRLYAIVAGVNNFNGKNVKALKYSENDAQAIKIATETKMKTIYADVNVSYLIGEDVTKDNILKAVQAIAKEARLEDTILFYISTHGRAIDGEFYLIPYNSKNGNDWIDFGNTFKAIQSIKSLNQIFVIDACESGKADDIVSAVYDSRASVLAKSSGVHMLLATTRGTSAFEHPNSNIKNGVFTYRILQALESPATDINGDKFISVKELATKLKEPQNNTDYQYPVIRNVGRDVELERVE
ncbi:WD-repeat protein [hydrothermal vent metagenome]|uniref:WD-repeat protein n=1 Tax=hydrothermal vent metagenome TaxID=652676 RepID=A0A1W1CUG9_9ZZZZ